MPIYGINPPAVSRMAGATAAAPGAGSNVVSIAAPPAGAYRATVLYILTGTQESQPLNLRLKANNVGILDLPTGQTTAAGNLITVSVGRVDLDGVNVVAVGAIAAATAGSVYTVVLILDRIG